MVKLFLKDKNNRRTKPHNSCRVYAHPNNIYHLLRSFKSQKDTMNALSQSILSSRVSSTSAFTSTSKSSSGSSNRRGALQVMAASKKKDVRLQVTLECTEQREAGVQGMSRYITQKNRRNNSQRIELMKYNPYMKKHTLHRELKK